MATNRPRKRRPTFDSLTEFEDYTSLFDQETRDLLQKDEALKNRPISTAQNSNNEAEAENLSNGTNSYFKQWHQSRRRTLDELESRGVLNPNFSNLKGSNASLNDDESLHFHRKALEYGDLSILSADDIEDEDDFEAMEFNKNDLFYIHCHQIIKKELRNNMFSEEADLINNGNRIAPITTMMNDLQIRTKEGLSAPPPTAVHTPLTAGTINITQLDFDAMQNVKSKLERHSKQMEEKEMIEMQQMLENNEEEEDYDYNDIEEEAPETRISTHYSSQKSIQSLLSNACDANISYLNNDNNNNNNNDNINVPKSSTNAFNILYESIPSHLDCGILSSSIFLAYKQWIESRIIRHTEEAGECLDQMKKESNMLEKLHRDTVHKSTHNMLYGDDDDSNNNNNNKKNHNLLHSNKNDHLRKLSQIDENLADIRDKIKRMARVQKHIIFIQQQYDTHMNDLREDQTELLSILSELRERQLECESILSALCENEVWLITNMANIMAERSENIDTLNRRISECEDASISCNAEIESVQTTKEFIQEVNHLIGELRVFSDRKRGEILRLKSSVASMTKQNAKLCETSQKSYMRVIDRLFDLQKHYKLPQIMEYEARDDIYRHNQVSEAIGSSLNIYLTRINCSNYYNRSLDAHQSAYIYSKPHTLKIAYIEYIFLIENVFIDCMLLNEYIATNINNNMMKQEEEEEEEAVLNEHNKQSSTALLNDVFTPITIQPSEFSQTVDELQLNPFQLNQTKDAQTLLNDALFNSKQEAKFESIHFLNKNVEITNCDLLKKIKIIALFVNILCFRETIVAILAQEITMKYKVEIEKIENKEKIKQLAIKYAIKFLIYILNNHKILIKSIRNENKQNVYKIAAFLLNNVYKINIPFSV